MSLPWLQVLVATLAVVVVVCNRYEKEWYVQADLTRDIDANDPNETTEEPSGYEILPVDCTDHLLLGRNTSGVYDIYPFSCSCRQPVSVWCDMESDGGGWTVFMWRKKQTPQENFNRSWVDYKEGFGNADGEHWLGNEMLHKITSSRKYNLRLDLQLTNGVQQFGEWENFRIEEERNKYRMYVHDYLDVSTTYQNCLYLMSSRYFTTYDRDYDIASGNCAATRGGGWWYYNCRYTHMTGVYNDFLKAACYTSAINVTEAQMKIRPAICSEPFKRITLNSRQCGSCL